MVFDQNIDPRPKERVAWVEKFRKVKPAPLPNLPAPAAEGRTGPAGGRRSVVNSGLEEYSGPWESAQVSHLLRRTLFGVTKSDLDYFQSLSLGAAVDQLLTPSPAPAPPVNDYQNVDDDAIDPTVAFGQSWIDAPHAGDKEGYRIISLKSWLIKNIVTQQRTLHEKMKFFWSNLLVTKVWDVYISKASYRFFEMLHTYSLGNYKDLIKALTLDPSMLIFLNGASNNKSNPNENYARELQELFCVGKGAGSKYTEDDVKAAARVLTGWVIDWNAYVSAGPFESFFAPSLHDESDKQFSSFYGNKVISGKSGSGGANELDELLSMIITTEETSRYICRRLYSYFVYSEIDETTEKNIIEPLAVVFRSNNYEIIPVLRKLFRSAHFFDVLNSAALIKSPAEHVLGLSRCLALTSPATNDLLTNYKTHTAMLWHMASMGLEMADPPNVAGWPSYYQAPQFDQAWITTDTITIRALTTDSLIYWGFWISEDLRLNADLPAFVSKLEMPLDPNALLEESAILLLGMKIPEATRNNLKSILLTGQTTDAYWTTAWSNYTSNPANADNKQIVVVRLQATFQRLMQLGEFHLK